jgi:hypothetical protein
VAFHALSARAHIKKNLAISGLYGLSLLPFFLVKVMITGVIDIPPVALEAKIIALLDAFYAVYIVAVRASHIAIMHLALDK